MKIFCILLAALLFLPALALAENDSVVMGSYKVSFDLAGAKNMISYHLEPVHESTSEDLSSDYKNIYYFSINISQPSIRKNEYLYNDIDLELITSNSIIPKYDELYYKKEIYNLLAGPRGTWCGFGTLSSTNDFDFSPRIIDGGQGYVGSGGSSIMFAMTSYAAIFHPSIDPDHVECRIFSNLVGWDEGTLQLLKTIHIEKINATI
jgi:hypothetical protein